MKNSKILTNLTKSVRSEDIMKTPKIYFRDSGIFHTLLGVSKREDLLSHPKLGFSWEGFVLEEIIRHHHVALGEAYFWAVHSQGELDLLIVKQGKRLGFEIKYTDSPKVTKSMRMAKESLKLDRLTVIIPGKGDFPLTKEIRAVGIEKYLG